MIDDEPDMVMTLLSILRDEGYEAKGFASGPAALKELPGFDPDVVISDLAMPLVDGWELAKEVRRTMGASRPVLIALSGQYRNGHDKARSESAGFNHYLTKPCDPKVLVALIASAK